MAHQNEQEIEVKFYLNDLGRLEQRLVEMGAKLKQERVYEINLRFDTPDEELARSFRVLRLRQDTAARLTYKGPGQIQDGARLRQEIEFTVSDFGAAKSLFEALGYRVSVMYEKYRATYALENVLVTLDEMPYGTFAEIEGPDGRTIQSVAGRLGMDWEARILDSYLALFDKVRVAMALTFHDLSFENFEDVMVSPAALGVKPADG